MFQSKHLKQNPYYVSNSAHECFAVYLNVFNIRYYLYTMSLLACKMCIVLYCETACAKDVYRKL